MSDHDRTRPSLIDAHGASKRYRVLFALFVLLAASAAQAESESDQYLKAIKPVLKARCFACHGALKQESDLRLDTVASMRDHDILGEGGELLTRITASDLSVRMPPEGEPLQAHEIAAIKKWTARGATGPTDEKPEADPKSHWAFQRIERPEEAASGQTNPIDAYFAADHQAQGLVPQPAAPRTLLLRRIYLDLTGLPPTVEQLSSTEPLSKIIDDALSSPQYGERWGRHWMDVWRYSDWYGLGDEVRDSQKHLWRWRDWIIDSLNENKGYDQMVREMLAGDEIAPNNPKVLAATGFLARSYYKFNRTSWLDNTIEHTSKAFMGLTMNCAKCHDHKYDPISHLDYYKFRAIFEPHQVRVDAVPGELDLTKDGLTRVYDGNLTASTYLHERGDESKADKSKKIIAGPPSFLATAAWQTSAPIELPFVASRPDMRTFVQEMLLAQAMAKVTAAEAHLDEMKLRQPESDTELALAKLNLAKAEYAFTKARIDADNAIYRETGDGSPENAGRKKLEAELARARVSLFDPKKATKATETINKLESDLKAGEFPPHEPLRVSQVSLIKTSDKDALPTGDDYPRTSTGRRTTLAHWLTHRDHPLTARVAVNHIWMRHFGTPLVESVADFGLRAPKPLHQDLLDWLAVELIESGWDMKHLHRLILSSNTWQRSSSNLDADEKTLATDGNNRHYWRMNSRRMEAQVVRDSLLHLAGALDLTRGGPSVTPAPDVRRRSLYFFHSRDGRSNFLETFDDADVFACYRRSESIVPQQALAMMNSQTATESAKQIDAKFEPGLAPEEFAGSAFFEMVARHSTEAELAESVLYLKDQPNREHFILALINLNDFLVIR